MIYFILFLFWISCLCIGIQQSQSVRVHVFLFFHHFHMVYTIYIFWCDWLQPPAKQIKSKIVGPQRLFLSNICLQFFFFVWLLVSGSTEKRCFIKWITIIFVLKRIEDVSPMLVFFISFYFIYLLCWCTQVHIDFFFLVLLLIFKCENSDVFVLEYFGVFLLLLFVMAAFSSWMLLIEVKAIVCLLN